jgi:Glycosyl transferases group 1
VKVAMITRGSPDYLPDLVADGLIRSLGRENVHLMTGMTKPSNPCLGQLGKGYDIPNQIGLYDTEALIISIRGTISDIRDWRQRTGKKAVAVLDGEDDGIIRSDWLGEGTLYFKREYYKNRPYDPKIRPLSFGAFPEPVPEVSDPRAGVFFRMRPTDPIRTSIGKDLAQLGYSAIESLVAKDRYNEDLARAAVGISARGMGWDTYRYWEVPYFGALLFSQNLGIVVPGDFVDGVEALFFDAVYDFLPKLKAILADPPRLQEIRLAGQKASHSRHLSIHRARRVLEEIA